MLQPIRPQDAGQVYQRQVVSSEAAAASARRAETASSAGGGAARRTDRVMFSAAALDLSRALRAASDASDVRMERVEALRAAIDGGTYRVDADGIADALVQHGFGASGGAS